jgi:hypothetical protein
LLAVRRQDGEFLLSRSWLPIGWMSLNRLLKAARSINAKPLYAVRVKLKGVVVMK